MSQQRKWHIFILSLLFSFLLWVSVNLGARYQAFINVKLEPANIPEGKALVNPLPNKVSVKFIGIGWQLASIYFNPNVRYELDLSTLKNSRFISLKERLFDFIKVPFRIEAIDVFPDSLDILLDDYIIKKVPVKPNIEVNCIKGYGVIGSIKTNPDSIYIGGAARVLKNIYSWPTEYQKYSEVKDDIVNLVALSDTLSQIFKVSHRVVGIDIKIQMLAEQKYHDINVEVINQPKDISVNLIPPKINITLRGGVDILTNIDKSNFRATVDYKSLLNDSTGYVTPNISVPEKMQVILLEPHKFEFVIRKNIK